MTTVPSESLVRPAPPPWWLAAGLLLSLALLAIGDVNRLAAQAPPALRPVAGTAEEAVGQVVTAQGGRYAGDCATTRAPQDVGLVCSRFVAERAGQRAYLMGRTFSEFTTWAFVRRQPTGWQVVTTAPLAFTETTGTGAIPWPGP